MTKIAIAGVGGRTGTMFAFELREKAQILGIGKEKEVEMIKKGCLYVERKDKKPQLFKEKTIKDTDFEKKSAPDIIFLATKNPISPSIKYYYQKLLSRSRRKKLPALFISQNGISAISEAEKTISDIFGKEAEKIRIIRVILFNPVDKKEAEGKIIISYSLPVKMALAQVSGPEGIEDIVELFKGAGFEAKEYPKNQGKNIEFSKLFLNLIGMASASQGFAIKEGFANKQIFEEEIVSLREYVKTVKSCQGRLINFPDYPVALLAVLISQTPLFLLSLFRNALAGLVGGSREGKAKNLDEIDYYNGAVVSLGIERGVKTPINEIIAKRARNRLFFGGRGRI